MSAQLLICKFAVFTCVSFFLPMPRVTHMACWLAVCQDPKVFQVLYQSQGQNAFFTPTSHQRKVHKKI